jgi:arylformamidase
LPAVVEGCRVTKFIELNHVIENGMPAYPGIPGPRIFALLDHGASREHYEGMAEFYLGRADLSGNTGTYLDSPFHRDPDGADLSELPLSAVAGLEAVVIDAEMTDRRSVDVELVAANVGGRAVLVRTGWDRNWGSDEYWTFGPHLSAEAVRVLAGARPALVGVDFSNVDDTNDPSRPAHTRLLRSGILILEHLCNLDDLPEKGALLYAVPLRISGGASFSVRAFAEVRD